MNGNDLEIAEKYVRETLYNGLEFDDQLVEERFKQGLMSATNLYDYVNKKIPVGPSRLVIPTTWDLPDSVDRPKTINAIQAILNQYKDMLIPRKTNLVYIKLETGGLNGYIHEVRKIGQNYYPILRVTAKVNDKEPLDVFIKPEAPEPHHLSSYANKAHIASGLLDRCREEGISLEEADIRLSNHLIHCGVTATDPASNIHTHLVAANSQFVTDFTRRQLSRTMRLFSPKTIDVLPILTLLELSGNYGNNRILQELKGDPIRYVETLARITNDLMTKQSE